MKKVLRFLTLAAMLCIPWVTQAQQTAPYNEGFEGMSTVSDLNTAGWELLYQSSSSSASFLAINTTASNASAGSNSLNIDSWDASSSDYVIVGLPLITNKAVNELQITFSYKVTNTSVTIGYLTNANDANTFVAVENYSGSSSFTTKTVEFGSVPASAERIAIKYTGYYRCYVDAVAVEELPSCFQPQNITATLTPGNGSIATLTWQRHANGTENNWVLEYGTASDFADATQVNVSGTPTANLTGLTAETQYYARVKADCGGGDVSDWSTTCTFTPSNAYTITVNDGAATNEYVPFYGYYADETQQNQMIYPASGLSALNGKIITEMVFYIDHVDGTNSIGNWIVSLGETAATTLSGLDNTTVLTEVYSGAMTFNAGETMMTVTFTDGYLYQGGNLLVEFNHPVAASYKHYYFTGQSVTGASYCYGSQRNFLPKTTFTFETPGSCPKPTVLTLGAITASEAPLTWTAGGSEESWKVYLNGALVATVATNSYTFTGLTANTDYTFGVAAVCDVDDESTIATVAGHTACGTYAIPYSYGFETDADMTCWTVIDVPAHTTIDDGTAITGASARTGDNFFVFTYYDYPDVDPQYMTLISPELTGIANGLHVEFYYLTDGENSYPETFKVGYSTTNTDLSSFTWVNTVTDVVAADYQLFKANYPANTKYVAVQHLSDDMDYLVIDDFSFTEAPDCREPSNIIASSITTSGANLSWTNGGAETEWEIFVTDDIATVPTDMTTPTYTDVTTRTNYAIGGLAAGTSYYVYIRSSCGVEHSDWSNMYTFNSACELQTLPYSYDFEDDVLPVCWNTIGGNTGWIVSGINNAAPQNGSHNLSIQCSSNETGAQYFVLPEVDVTNYPIDEYEITFYSTLAGSSTTGRTVAIGVMTDPNDASTFVQIGEAITPATTYTQYKVRFLSYTGNGHYIAIKHNIATGSYGYSYTYIDNINVTHLPACFETSTPAVGTVTNHTAALTWTTDVASASYNIDYREASTVIPEIEEGFEGSTTWTHIGEGSANTTTTASRVHEGSKSLQFQGATADNVVVMPATSDELNTMVISFWSLAESGSSSGNFDVGYVTDAADASTFEAVGTYAASAHTSYTQVENVSFAGAPAGARAAFRHRSGATYFYWWIDEVVIGTTTDAGEWQHETSDVLSKTLTGLDPETKYDVRVQGNCGGDVTSVWSGIVSFTTDIACPAPTTLAYSNLKSNQVDLSWTETGTANAWVVAYKADADADFTEVDATTNPFTLEGLNPEVHYTVKVEANCEASYVGDGTSEFSSTVDFTTLEACAQPRDVAATNITNNSATISWTGDAGVYGFNLKYRVAAHIDGIEEHFDVSGIPSGWTQYAGLVDDVIAGSAELQSATAWGTSNYSSLGTYTGRLNIYGSSRNHWLVTPTFTLAAGSAMSFDLALTDYNSSDAIEDNTAQSDDRFAVLVYADGDWTILREWNNSGSPYVYNDIATDGELVNDIDISAYVGKTVKFAFYGESTVSSNGDNDLHIDNVTIGLHVAAGDWNNDNAGINVGTATSHNITGLTAETKYEVQVEALCGSHPVSDPYFFTTLYGFSKDIAANTWYAISSPAHNSGNNETFAGVTNLTSGTYDLLYWDQANGTWKTSKPAVITSFTRGQGYIYRRSDAATLTFVGQRNSGNFNSDYLYYSCPDLNLKGFHLVGNPYAKAYTPTVDYYKLNANGTWTANTASTGSVAVAEGFFIKKGSSGYYAFAEPSGAKSAPRSNAAAIALTVSNDEYSDIAYACFSDGEGMPKMSHLNPEAPALSIPQGDRRYAIANLDENTESFPLHFSGFGEYTFSLSDNSLGLGYLHLIDRETGADVDMLRQSGYTFNANGNESERFVVLLRPTADANSFVRVSDSRLIVDGEGELQVFDVMGRQLGSAQVDGTTTLDRRSLGIVGAGVYVLRLNGNSQKIVVK